MGDTLVNQVKSELSGGFQIKLTNLQKQLDEKSQWVINKESQLKSEIENIKHQSKRLLEKAEIEKENEIENIKIQTEKNLKSQLAN